MIDEAFYHPRTPIAVIAIGDAGEALLIRSILESLGAAVSLHLIGTPSDFLKCLGQGELAPEYIIVSGHGDEAGFVFGEVDADVDQTPLVEGSLSPAVIAGAVNLPAKIVVSTACLTGTSEFAQAFLSGGIRAYIAPSDYPDGAAIALFIHGLFYNILQRKMPLGESVERALSFDLAGDLSIVTFKADIGVVPKRQG